MAQHLAMTTRAPKRLKVESLVPVPHDGGMAGHADLAAQRAEEARSSALSALQRRAMVMVRKGAVATLAKPGEAPSPSPIAHVQAQGDPETSSATPLGASGSTNRDTGLATSDLSQLKFTQLRERMKQVRLCVAFAPCGRAVRMQRHLTECVVCRWVYQPP